MRFRFKTNKLRIMGLLKQRRLAAGETPQRKHASKNSGLMKPSDAAVSVPPFG